MLRCNWCKEEKPDHLLVRRDAAKPYTQPNIRNCKQCQAAYAKHRYARTDVRSKQLRANAAWRKAHPEKQRQYEKQFAADRPAQVKARNRVSYLLRIGLWQRRTCEICGLPETEAHHDSYAPAHWETVRWLCKEHHERWHQMLDPIKGEIAAESLAKVLQLRDEAKAVQAEITRLRARFQELHTEANANELATWNKVVEIAEPMFANFKG